MNFSKIAEPSGSKKLREKGEKRKKSARVGSTC